MKQRIASPSSSKKDKINKSKVVIPRKIYLNTAHLFRPSMLRNHHHPVFRTQSGTDSELYTARSIKYIWSKMFYEMIEEYNKIDLVSKIKNDIASLSDKEVISRIHQVRYFGSSLSQHGTFLNSIERDYLFHCDEHHGDWYNFATTSPKVRIKNPDGHLALPLMPVGTQSRYFLEDHLHLLYTDDFTENGIVPKDFMDAALRIDTLGSFDFIVHPFFHLVDEESQNRLAKKTFQIISVWRYYVDDILKGLTRVLFGEQAVSYFSTICDSSKEVKEDYYKYITFKRSKPMHVLYYKMSAIDCFLSCRNLQPLATVSSRHLKELKIDKPMAYVHGGPVMHKDAPTVYPTVVHYTNYLIRLLFYLLYEILKDDPAYCFMEKWFETWQKNPSQNVSKLFYKNKYKNYYRDVKKSSCGYAKNVLLLTDESLWMNEWVRDEKTSQSNGQFLFSVSGPQLSDLFETPLWYKLATKAYTFMDEHRSVNLEQLEQNWGFLSSYNKYREKEGKSAFQGIKRKFPKSYFLS